MRLRNARRFRRQLLQAAVSGLAIAVATCSGYKLHFNAATVILLYLLIIVRQALAGGFALSAIVSLAAAACLDFFFLPPILSLRIADPLNMLAFGVFLAISLVITHLVSRLRAEADTAQRRGANLEQLHRVTSQLLLRGPSHFDAPSLLQAMREELQASALCLFDAKTAEFHIDGAPHVDLAERTKQAYIAGKDSDDSVEQVSIRCLRVGATITGAIGFEGISEPEWMAGPLSALAAAVLEQARAFRKASHEIAAAQAEVFRTAILDALAHEFKTPLATILAVAGGLRESQRLGPEEMEMTGILESEASRLNSLTGRLLRIAWLDREEVKPRLSSTNICALAERVIHRYSAHPSDRQIAVICSRPPAEALADRQLLDLALTQLLDNALKYSVAGSAVTVRIGADREFATVRVQNEGSSIAPRERDRIFERFYRGSDVRKLVSGAGLGLYVARKIAIAHGGSLDLDETTSPGTVVFCLKLPVQNNKGNHHAANGCQRFDRR
jgi:two-component system, OmpR family, sensor histidine kinase KdpD